MARVTISGWPSLGVVNLVACGCESCSSGKTIAIDRYPGVTYPAVFPGMGDRPQHFQSWQVIHEPDRFVAERRAAELQTGIETD